MTRQTLFGPDRRRRYTPAQHPRMGLEPASGRCEDASRALVQRHIRDSHKTKKPVIGLSVRRHAEEPSFSPSVCQVRRESGPHDHRVPDRYLEAERTGAYHPDKQMEGVAYENWPTAFLSGHRSDLAADPHPRPQQWTNGPERGLTPATARPRVNDEEHVRRREAIASESIQMNRDQSCLGPSRCLAEHPPAT